MLNFVCKYILKKDIVLYKPHRQTFPIISNEINQSNYIFINLYSIWKLIPFSSKNKMKFKVMYLILNIINPKLIIDINWITIWESLYLVWTKNHKKSKFIVVQHGSYVAGVVNDVAHKYTKCDVFLIWGNYFKELFENYNKNKRTQIISFGNPVYNTKNRDNLRYSNNNTGNVLIAPSAINQERLSFYSDLFKKIEMLGFNVFVKTHAKQGTNKILSGNKISYPVLEGVNVIDKNLEEVLKKNNFDFIISDHSTSLLDAIFFKNKVLYFSPMNHKEITENHYSKYLVNIFDDYKKFKTKEEIYSLLSIKNQESLFSSMINAGDNILTKDKLYRS